MSGEDLTPLENEAGGHRVQRVPPTEKRGRVHTSTVTVAITDPDSAPEFTLRDDEIRVEWFSGTGKGGQHRNKHQNSCRIIHTPTGTVETRQGRHRDANYRDARTALEKRLTQHAEIKSKKNTDTKRREQVGSGMRADKTVTIQFQNNKAINHMTNKTITATSYMKGYMDNTWPE